MTPPRCPRCGTERPAALPYCPSCGPSESQRRATSTALPPRLLSLGTRVSLALAAIGGFLLVYAGFELLERQPGWPAFLSPGETLQAALATIAGVLSATGLWRAIRRFRNQA